ncbi:vancomycin resistance protein VanJ [Nocardia tenerifensis]|uniref:Vancomycin resistance protein VanJ n=1 Tax=Nocardia tenerifensis TaxID=228006 RepID=A0A318JUJ5_9NOCA|nr:endonuclease/exonuclease/phosphatase family protein [Nocardia tenerifensis]PXX60341.1 vancomycin resistance protein VanJ [Nocardia tenerifensis]
MPHATPKDLMLAAAAALLAALLLEPRLVPGTAGQIVGSFLPWLLAPTVLLAAVAVGTGSKIGTAAVVPPIAAWSVLFVPQLVERPDTATTTPAFRVATQNLGTAGTAAELTDAAVISVQELTDRNRPSVAAALDPRHPHVATVGTIGLWSRYPLHDIERLDLGQGWARALRARIELPAGEATVYAVHLGSIRLGETAARDRTLHTLTDLVRRDPSTRLLVLGDLNTASTDPALTPLTQTLHDVRTGLAFTWPAPFPLTNPDHILTRGFTPLDATVRRTPGTDHRAPTATLAPTPHPPR